MEKKGLVNQYNDVTGFKRYYTLNLATGTTPFCKMFDGQEFMSNCYRLTHVPLVTHVWYRPTKEEFDKLDKDMQDHVLNGGLCFAKLNEGVTLENDPTTEKTGYEEFQEWCKAYYGRRLQPMPQAFMSNKRT